MVENEELYGKVREAQTLSRKDSVKAKQLETEVDLLKDEFDRLRVLYESTRDDMEKMEVSVVMNLILIKVPCHHSQCNNSCNIFAHINKLYKCQFAST